MNFIFLQLGYFFEGKELDDVFWRFKSVAEKKKVITRIIPFDFMVVPFPGSMKQCQKLSVDNGQHTEDSQNLRLQICHCFPICSVLDISTIINSVQECFKVKIRSHKLISHNASSPLFWCWSEVYLSMTSMISIFCLDLPMLRSIPWMKLSNSNFILPACLR